LFSPSGVHKWVSHIIISCFFHIFISLLLHPSGCLPQLCFLLY
jgi:hypothetical protein